MKTVVKVKEDLTGLRFGKLTVIKQVEDRISSGKRFSMWLCKCDCGKSKEIFGNTLKSGKTTSCGCKYKSRKRSRKYNEYDIQNYDYGVIYIGENEVLFDLEDYEKIKNYTWNCRKIKNGYISVNTQNGGQSLVLSRLIMGCDESNLQVDHKNHNTLDNRKSNLRIVTVSQNNMNKNFMSNNTSGHIGVSFNKRNQKYVAYIKKNKKYIHLGSFDNIDNAIIVREKAEEKYFKDYSYKNSNK